MAPAPALPAMKQTQPIATSNPYPSTASANAWSVNSLGSIASTKLAAWLPPSKIQDSPSAYSAIQLLTFKKLQIQKDTVSASLKLSLMGESAPTSAGTGTYSVLPSPATMETSSTATVVPPPAKHKLATAAKTELPLLLPSASTSDVLWR
jgi:hypothetical protein